VTLTASFTDGNPGLISTSLTANFYVEMNNDGTLEPGPDTLLGSGTATYSAGTWTFSLTTNSLKAGTYTLWVQAVDDDGVLSDPVAITFTVT
jgi:hypothetical protein